MKYDLAIIGGGPAGASAAVYAARKKLRTVMITKDWLGQSYVSEGIQNWIGSINIPGIELAKSLENHAKFYGKDIIDFMDGEICTKLEKTGDTFKIISDKNTYEAKTVLITSGSSRRQLEVKGAKELEHKGLTYCASCDGPMYGDQDVVVVGGGNAAFESAAQLLAYCKSVTLMIRGTEFRADPGTVEKVLSNPKMKAIKNAIPKEVKGEKFVSSFVYTDSVSGKDIELPVAGIFVEIGALPNTSYAKDLIKLDKNGHVITDPRTQATSVEGIWAAGDCTDGLYHQNNIAVGDAVKALEDIYVHLHTK